MTRDDIHRAYLADEPAAVDGLIQEARATPAVARKVRMLAAQLVASMRRRQDDSQGIHAFLRYYDLSSQEGIVLMCLAESLLRIPDSATADRLIADKLTSADWRRHLGASDSLFVNASTWALMLTGRFIELGEDAARNPSDYLARTIARLDDPVIRGGLRAAMRIMASQFVMGRTIGEALERAGDGENRMYRYSYDMLGEAALTEADARRFHDAYAEAIRAVGAAATGKTILERPGVSVKLSALFPRFEFRQRGRAIRELRGRLLALAELAAASGIGLTVDAEESDRLEPALAVLEEVYSDATLGDWPGLGTAVQAYQKRAPAVIDWLEGLAAAGGRPIPVRLVKGAYWDTEIKRAQEQGLRDYPVYTRKCNTDISYLACARRMLREGTHLLPQFATHNAHTLAWIQCHAGKREYEFQRLHGMGAELYADVVGGKGAGVPCRVYAPVGAHEDLLPYLVRRLLENGANTSFVNQVIRHGDDPERAVEDPVAMVEADPVRRHPAIPLPADLFAPGRRNSSGVNLADPVERRFLVDAVNTAAGQPVEAAPLIAGRAASGRVRTIRDPADRRRTVGNARFADAGTARQALDTAASAWSAWERCPASERAAILERAADLFEEHRPRLMGLCVREGGRTLVDAASEIREAVDFLRYYAAECRRQFAAPLVLPGPAGESNELRLRARGVFLCISPWNFPVAIYTGQVAAAIAAGNAVLAKPAEQTPLAAHVATRLLIEAGVPADVLQFIPGSGPELGQALLSDPRVAGVAFTGSTETAQRIGQLLASRNGPLATLIAETGGQNVLIADSSALPEQLAQDAAYSAFNSAGQRCSALRVLYLQEEIADRVLAMLAGLMDELVIGDPLDLATDVGPVIDEEARAALETHVERMSREQSVLHRCRLPAGAAAGTFVAPTLVQIDGIGRLEAEVFGPVLHVVRYAASDLDRVIDGINGTGFGLTLGVHSRIADTAEHIRSRVRAGNVYVNRNMVGAVVGVQPFGGTGLSGTGPKAGGPHYLARFATEQTYTVNTAAVGGNASLLSLNH
jgi:RHH-type proline utilization regulon transcriptional repressor/proline dehydrogenase/delta 1-pyrroline-5-carboxylate dehydrogenase